MTNRVPSRSSCKRSTYSKSPRYVEPVSRVSVSPSLRQDKTGSGVEKIPRSDKTQKLLSETGSLSQEWKKERHLIQHAYQFFFSFLLGFIMTSIRHVSFGGGWRWRVEGGNLHRRHHPRSSMKIGTRQTRTNRDVSVVFDRTGCSGPS